MIERFKRFRRLNAFGRSIAVEAAAGLLATWFGLRLIGFRRWERVLAVFAPSANASALASERECALLIARLEAAAARNVLFQPSCLEQSLVLWWLLRRRGIAAEVRIGARKDSDRFEAHAWVEFDSQVLNDASADHRRFIPFEKPILSIEARIE
ncbi:MAG: lasso peptide biosynthesis B2 protein [Candidatus Acidiferrales bacterium]